MAPRWWAGVAAGVVLGLGVVVAVEAGTPDASAQSGFTASAEQLRTNQRISIAAVRRSNEALNLLDPITRQPKLPQKALGWRSQDLRDGAVSTGKIANGAVTEGKLAAAVADRLPVWAVVNSTGSVARSSGGMTSSKTSLGLYRVDVNRAVGSCAWTGTQVTTDPAPELGSVGIELDPVDPERLLVRTTDSAGDTQDRTFSIQVTC